MGREWEQMLRARRAEFLRQNERAESLSQQLQDAREERDQARRWAWLWKCKTRQYRALHQYFVNLYLAESVRRDCLEDKYGQALVWKRLWKRAAKVNRFRYRLVRGWWRFQCQKTDQLRAKIVRLRESLEGIGGFARMLCETQDQMHPAHIRLVAMITDAATAALYFPPGAHWYTPDSYDPETGIWHDKLGGDNLYQSDKQNPIRVVGKDSADD